MKQKQRVLGAILDALSDGILAYDLDGTIVACNDRALELLHVERSLLGENVAVLEETIQAFLREARSGDRAVVTLGERAVQLGYMDLMEGNLRTGSLLTVTDIGEQNRMEHIRRDFTANVSHELKTPLTSISGYAEMIATGMAKPEDVSAFAERIRRESNRMLNLVSDIIQLTELDERGLAAQTERVDLYALVEECIEILRSAAMVRGVSVTLSGNSTEVQGNRTLLNELVYNLLENAIRYNRDNGTVAIRVFEHTISVRDTGIGIPKAHQSRIFERFYRVDKSRSKETGGTGLGLAIVKHIVEQHHATLRLDSREGIGTEITVRFPESEDLTTV